MKLAVNTYPFLLTTPLEEAVDRIAENGYQEIEFLLSPGHFHITDVRPGDLRRLKAQMDRLGVRAKSVLMPSVDLNLCSPFPEMRQMSVMLYKKAIDIASVLESDCVVVVLGKRHVLLPPPLEYILSLSRASLEELVRYSEPSGLTIAVETISANLLDTVEQTVDFVDQINDPRVRMCFDVANVYAVEDVDIALDRAKGRIALVHLSDTGKGNARHDIIGTREMDFAKIFAGLKRVGYDGSVVIEITDCGGTDSINRSKEHLVKEGWEFV